MPQDEFRDDIRQLTAAVNTNTIQQGILVERVGNLKDTLDAHVKVVSDANVDHEDRLRNLEKFSAEYKVKVGILSSAVSAVTASLVAFVQYLTGHN